MSFCTPNSKAPNSFSVKTISVLDSMATRRLNQSVTNNTALNNRAQNMNLLQNVFCFDSMCPPGS